MKGGLALSAFTLQADVVPTAAKFHKSVNLRRLRRLLRRILHLQLEPWNFALRRKACVGAKGLDRSFQELAGLSPENVVDALQVVEGLVQRRQEEEKSQRLTGWRTSHVTDEAKQRRWIKQRSALQEELQAQGDQGIGHPGNKSLHPVCVLREAAEEWHTVWQRAEVDLSEYLRMLSQVPRPDEVHVDMRLTTDMLRRSARRMIRKAKGPDGWSTADWQALPDLWWDALTELWNVVIRSGSIPIAWSDARVALIPKGLDDTRPLSLNSVAWRCGANAIMKLLKPWSLTWLDSAVLGGVTGSSALDAHIRIHQAVIHKSCVIAQDLSKFFDSIDWRLLDANLQWVHAPEWFRRLIQTFYPIDRVRQFSA